MPSFDYRDEAARLVNEVVDWARLDSFFRNADSSGDIGTPLPYAIKEPAAWFEAIDINNEDSSFLELKQLMNDVARAYRLIHQYGPEDFEEFVSRANESIGRHVAESEQVERFAQALFARNTMTMEWPEYVGHLRIVVTSHLAAVVEARAASVSTRYAPTETLFELYRHGLFPFGWDWDFFWCLDPSRLMK